MIQFDSQKNFFCSTLINDGSYFSAFCCKKLGDARRSHNITTALTALNVDYAKLVIPQQIHSTNIELFTLRNSNPLEIISETDGVITENLKTVLTVRTGDCLPIIFVDKKRELIGISHQGWKGSLRKMIVKMIDKMIDHGASLENIKIAIGPGIGECCYNVEEDRFYEFADALNGMTDKIFHYFRGERHLNLLKLNYLLLIERGIKPENIDTFPFCTFCDKKRFFSYRRDKREDYGEMLSFVLKIV